MKKNYTSHPPKKITFFFAQPDEEEIEKILFRFIYSSSVVLITIFMLVILGSTCSYSQAPGTATEHLNISNVDATIMNGGDMFWDLNNAGFEVPKGSGKHSIFAAGLWIGGLSVIDSLHIAAQTYRQTGNDYWPGPIDTSCNAAVSSNWDSIWKVNKSVVDNHIQNWNTGGYIVPQEIATWPANGTPPFAPILAPFVDLNGNYTYEPSTGEFPYILGDQATYAMFNDIANTHTETGGLPLGIEVHQMSYEINSATDSFLTNTVFMRYEIGNRCENSYHDVYLGIWVDFDLGNAMDDYVGTDVGRNMVYVYNGDADDETIMGYGLNPPACGMMFLSHNLTHSMTYNNVNLTPNGNPGGSFDFYNYLRSIWLDNLPLTYGGDGRDQSAPLCNFMFPGDTDPNFPGQPWTETTAGNPPYDRRILGSIGPLTLPADSFFVIDIAFPWARGDNGPGSSVTALQEAADSIANRYANGTLTTAIHNQFTQQVNRSNDIRVYPNPISTESVIRFRNPSNDTFVLEVRDITGKIVKTVEGIKGNEIRLSKEGLQPGVFTIKLQSVHDIYTTLVVVK